MTSIFSLTGTQPVYACEIRFAIYLNLSLCRTIGFMRLFFYFSSIHLVRDFELIAKGRPDFDHVVCRMETM